MMLDGGRDLEPGAENRRQTMAATDPDGWEPAARADWMKPQFTAGPGQIRRYGSDFAVEPATAILCDPPSWFGLRASRARGGLSNLWGSAVLPYARSDLTGWPVRAEELAPHYRAVAEFLPISGRADALEMLFPDLPMTGRVPIQPAPQAAELLRRAEDRTDALAKHGVVIGMARQAVAPGCRLCGMCLHGCPYGLIWSGRHALAQLQALPGFDYRPGDIVRSVAEDVDGAIVTLETGQELRGDRIFLAAGVLETARIVLRSQSGPGELTLRDSQHGFLPMLHRWPNRTRPDRGRFHTLPQAFAELRAADMSPHLVHAQIYSWNEHFPRDLVDNYGRVPILVPLLRGLARRLMVAQIFLHSDHSHGMTLQLAPDGRLKVGLQRNPETDAKLRAAARRLAKAFSALGLFSLPQALRIEPPGSSFHVGASLPMHHAPQAGQSDLLGRPHGWSRLHVVDASSLPAIPATTITLSVMANAHRIATNAP
ncbi:choline dehydrogenase-like flavoprotein [Albidovulum inexpectatum]|uniref:Choline dehydrogenase-like flavoprotein n=2 Tax=Albidovulum inexpectatum TaxID=196587 RepID=A0A2S5JDF5_9RHOB|nr:choline dehydrogenase-like flavoprotein [Albidovulum inexpectatum]